MNERWKEWTNEWQNNDWIITMIKWRYNEEKKEWLHNSMIKL
jgi:hypothetical protein